MLLARISLVFALTFSPVAAMSQTFGAQEFTLENGLQVVVIPNHRAPVVTSMLWIKVGGSDEQPGLSGMAHYLEHLMFKGTANQAPGEFSKTIKTLGGDDNAFTSRDFTAFFETVSVEHLPKVLEMEADRLVNLNPPPEHFASEKSVVLEERRQRTDNDPRAKFGEQLNSLLYVNHPYAIPVIGWMNEIEKYEWVDVKKFYDMWYAPNNAVLVVSGDMTMEKLKPMVEKYFGEIPRKEIPERIRPVVPPAPSGVFARLRDPDIHQSVFQKAYIAPTEAKDRNDSLALQVLAEIIDGGPTTRLYKSIVVEQKKATSVGFNYNGNALDYGSIEIGATPADGVKPEELGVLIEAEIKKIIDDGVTETETKEAISRLQDEAVYARDSLKGPAMIFGGAITTGSSIKDIESWPADIAKVTPAQVQAAAKKYLDAANPWIRPPVTGYLLPPEPEPVIEAPKAMEAKDVQG